MSDRFECGYSADGQIWFRFLDVHKTLEEAVALAESKANEEIMTRVVRVQTEVIQEFPKNPEKKLSVLFHFAMRP